MNLLEQIAFVIINRGWKNCYLIEFVKTSVANNKLNRELVNKKILKEFERENKMLYCKDCGYVKTIEKLSCWICSSCRLVLKDKFRTILKEGGK